VELPQIGLFLHLLADYAPLAFLVARLTPINDRLQHLDNVFEFAATTELSLGAHALLAQGAFTLATDSQLRK
jgi:hypothetical protein